MSLVQSFNALPRKPKAPSGLVPNVWHFDIRYVQFEPTPAHILAIIQPQSLFFHMERLPIGLPAEASGIEFFPESAKDAAPEIAKALLHAFVNNLGSNEMLGPNAPRMYAPWRLTTEDRDLADSVGEEFRRLGVHSDELCKIGLSTKSVNKLMQDHFHDFFQTLKKSIGIEDWVSAFIATPTSIMFQLCPSLARQPEFLAEEEDDDIDRLTTLSLRYVTELQKCRPHMAEDTDPTSAKLIEQIHAIRRMVIEKPASVVKAEADLGNPDAAFDYGIRLSVGLGCKYDRTLVRKYLIKALSSNASDKLKCAAHSALIDWYVFGVETLPSRYLLAASHHANVAASLSHRVSPDASAPPAVLWFMSRVFIPFSEKVPELWYLFKDAQKAMKARDEEIIREKEKMEVKRLKNPKRYRCAAVGCVIEADTGKMLSRCSGKCDIDKKPSYCSKDCQKADWKNHKPFCKPGMPCSVIDTGSSGEGTVPSMLQSQAGALQVPVFLSGGSTMRVASSTMDPKFLKEMKDHIEGLSEQRSVELPQNMIFELNRFQ